MHINLFMGWGVTLQKQGLITYPKLIGNPIVYNIKLFLILTYQYYLVIEIKWLAV